MKGSGEAFTIPTDDIKIFPCFAEHPPGADKMQSKARYFAEKGDLQSHIILALYMGQQACYTSCIPQFLRIAGLLAPIRVSGSGTHPKGRYGGYGGSS